MSALPELPPNFGPTEVRRDRARRPKWKTALRWVTAVILALVVILVIGVIALFRSKEFHSYVLRTAQFKASDTLNTNISLQDFSLGISGLNPTLDLYGITVNGAAPHASPPVLQAEHVQVGVRVVSLLSRKWYLGNVLVHHPVVRVLVDKNGQTNLPTPKSSGQKSNTDVFDLGIRHAVLDSGELYYNDQKSVLSADLKNLDLRAAFDPAAQEYSGTLAYSNGHIQVQHYAPLAHDLNAEFAATRERFTLRRVNLQAGQSRVNLSATVDDYSAPKVRGQYDASLNATELRRVLNNPNIPTGLVRAKGSVNYATDTSQPALNLLGVEGTLASANLQVHTPTFHTDIRDFGAHYSLQNGNLDIRDLRASLLGGQLSATASVRDIAGAGKGKLSATLRDISLADVKSAANVSTPNNVSLLGTANADVEATASATLKDLQAKANLVIDGKMSSPQATNVVPVTSTIHAHYSGPRQQITLTDSSVRTPQTTILLNGTAAARSAMQVRVQANDLHELETVSALFQTPTSTPPQPPGLFGRASFIGTVRGSTKAPEIAGQLSAVDFRLKGSEWRLLKATVAAAPTKLSIQNGELIPAQRGHIGFSLVADMRNWKPTSETPFQLALNLANIDASQVAKAAGFQNPIGGDLNGSATLHGTQLNPIGQGSIRFTNAKLGMETGEADLRFDGAGDTVHATIDLRSPAGAANGVVTYFPKQKGYEAQLRADQVNLAKLRTVQSRVPGLTGILTLSAGGHGTVDNPQLQATAQIPNLRIKNQTISNIQLRSAVENHVATLQLDSDVLQSHLNCHGTVGLTGDYNADLALDTQRIPLEPLLAAYAPAGTGDLTGVTELHATLRGPLKRKSLIEAHATIPELALNYNNNVQISAPNPIKLDYTNGVLNLQRASLRGTGTNLDFQGAVPVVDRTAPMSLLLLGTVDLRLAQMFDPEIASSGQLKFDINSYGRTTDPNIQGQVQIINAAFATPEAPLGLQNGNGVLTLTKDRLLISSFTGAVGSGTVVARGGVTYKPTMQFDLALEGRGIRLLYPPGVRSGLDLNLAMIGTTENSRLQGTVNVDQLSFTPDFDLMNMMGQFGGTVSPPPAQGFSDNLHLQIAVRSTSGINLVSRQLSVQGAANLNVRGTAAEPVVLGRVNLTGGDLIFRGNRYVLQGGTISFTNPVRTQPTLNVNVSTTIQQYNIAMRFEGPVDRLRTSYTSDPALPPSDIINLLAFGKTSEATAANPNPPGNLGAESAIASAVSGEVTSRVEKLAGISHLSVDPTLGQSNQNPGATVTIQQRVTGKIFVTFSTDVTSTQNQVIQLQYQQNPRLSFSGTRDQNGGFGFDVRLRREW